MADSVTRYHMVIDDDGLLTPRCPDGTWCRYSDVAQLLERKKALLREAAEAIERSSSDIEAGFGMCHATLELDALAARIREEIGE